MADYKQLLLQAWEEVDNNSNLDAVDQFFAPNFVRHGSRDRSRDDFKRLLTELRAGFPDLRQVTIEAVQEGNTVAYRWESEGTHLGPYLGALPTGRKIRACGITMSRFEDGLIVEDWASWNELSVLHDLRILPIDK